VQFHSVPGEESERGETALRPTAKTIEWPFHPRGKELSCTIGSEKGTWQKERKEVQVVGHRLKKDRTSDRELARKRRKN